MSTYRPRPVYAYAHVARSKPFASREVDIAKLFPSKEEREVVDGLIAEMKSSDKTLYECMKRLVLGGTTGFKMDVVADMVRKFPRYGSYTVAQRDYALSIVKGHHLIALLELIAREAEGEDTVAPAPPPDEEGRARREAAAAAAYDLKLSEGMNVSESNPLFGIF